jgi:K+-sensing histidine kinase KdpD
MVDQDVLRVVASHGMLARWWPDEGVPINRGSVTGRAVVDRQAVHIHDLASESDEEFPQGKVYQRLGGHRTNLAIPLLREGVAIGVIAMRQGEVRPFTDQQVGLLQTFADQAVIAIENVRLSKIEAGRMELSPAPFHLPSALENAVTLVKERASRHGIALQLDIDPRLGEVVGDERKVKQVLLNLLSNAVKFTPERLQLGTHDPHCVPERRE